MTDLTVRQALQKATARLAASGCSSALHDASSLLAHHLGIDRSRLFFHHGDVLPRPTDFEELLSRRTTREPLQHILGSAAFGPLDLAVGPGVFIPRPETEVLAEWAVQRLEDMMHAGIAAPRVVDLCTGSGALACWIAAAVPQARVSAVELSARAREYTTQNAAQYPNLEVLAGDATDPQLLRALDGQVDLIVTNPPYVPEDSVVEPEVAADPHAAVFAGADGMSVIEPMIPVLARLLRPGGAVGIEHDDATSQLVRAALDRCGAFSPAEVLDDLNGIHRFVIAFRN
ncbi:MULTISPECIES: peptide chain release factor N(5)-glutamine methyltransferase [Corynebacterium]|uniref:peptide chain release factor N(5)-glutamine methyltransferase n=1 Tax=Corynebacterium TaxID=1716 RepID=UPI00124EAB51|nr:MULTISPECIES: peptide chain release factor N(5)-glutamine methyltransferase [Corynebacterium]